MSCANFNLACDPVTGDYAICQGITYNCLTFYYQDGDISAYTPIGQIRDNYFQDGGNILATFNFEPITFGSVTIDGNTFNATVIVPFLTAAETAALTATLARANNTIPFITGVNGWVYDIKMIGTSETVPIAKGFVEVIRDVSR